jgi:hypothetical protein
MTKTNKTAQTVSVSIEDQLVTLQAIESNINLFLDLPVFKILSQLPAVLDVAVFIVSKDNKSVFNGTESVFRSNKDLILDFTIPDPIAVTKPKESDYQDKADFYAASVALVEILTDDNHPINVFNAIQKSLTEKIKTFDLVSLYANFRRAVDFVVSCDPSQFISNDPLTPAQLPSEIKAKIIAMVRASFAANPFINAKGKVQIEVPTTAIDLLNAKGEKVGSFVPNLDSLNNVLTFCQWRKEYPYSTPAFYGKELYLSIMQAVYRDCNCFETINNLASILDVDFGSSKNTDTILKSIFTHLL